MTVPDETSIESIGDLYQVFGGPTHFASLFEVSLGTVSSWQSRGYLPAHMLPRIVDKATELGLPGVTADVMIRIADTRKAQNDN